MSVPTKTCEKGAEPAACTPEQVREGHGAGGGHAWATVTCLSNVKQLELAFEMYGIDGDGWHPPASQWKSRLQTYLVTADSSRRPSRAELPWYYGQGYNIGCANQAG